MTNHGLTVRAWNDAAIARRDEDGYANATAMCQANGREWKAYHRIDRTLDYIQALATSLDLPAAELVITTTTGPNEFRGTWIHPRLAIDLARWCSPEFAVWMDGWFLEQLQQPTQQAAGLTAEAVARIAAETARSVAQAARPAARSRRRTPRQVRLPGVLQPYVPSTSHLGIMQRVQDLAATLGQITWSDLLRALSKAQRDLITPDDFVAAIRDLEAVGAGQITTRSRGSLAYQATDHQIDLQPPAADTDAAEHVALMNEVLRISRDGGRVWEDIADVMRHEHTGDPTREQIWRAMRDLDRVGAGQFDFAYQQFTPAPEHG